MASCWDGVFVCSGSSVPLQLGLPVCVPPQYSALREVSMEALRARLRLLYHFSDLMYSSWRLLNLSPNSQVYQHVKFASFCLSTLSLWKKHWFNHKSFVFQSCTSRYNAGTWGIVQGQLRPLLAPRVYTLPMVRSIGKTMVQGKNYGPQITVKRISTRSVMFRVAARTLKTFFASFSFELEHKNFLNHSFFSPFLSCFLRGRKCKPIFVQIARQVVKLNASDLRLPSRAWKVKLVGEGADDAGGVFDDTITEMCQVGRCWWRCVYNPITAQVSLNG